MSFSSFLQMTGAFFAGRLIDAKGSKFTMVLSCVSSILGYTMSYRSESIADLYISRIPVLAQQGVLAARAWVTVKSHSDPRMLGMVSLFYGFGTMFGPVLSGQLIKYFNGNSVISLVSTVFSVIGLIITVLFVDGEDQSHVPASPGNEQLVSEKSIWSFAENKELVFISIVKFFVILSSSIFHAILPILLAQRYELEPSQTGYIFALIGVTVVLSQVFYNFKLVCMEQMKVLLLATALMTVSLMVSFAIRQLH